MSLWDKSKFLREGKLKKEDGIILILLLDNRNVYSYYWSDKPNSDGIFTIKLFERSNFYKSYNSHHF